MAIPALEDGLKTSPILTRWFVFISLIILWIATRPYNGIVVDAQLYTFQAMAKLAPTKLSGDLFLKYGSQDQFTIYGYVLAFAIYLLGVAKANFLMAVAGGALWLTAMLFFTRSLFSILSYQSLAIWTAVILPANYGATYFYAQQYQSPRLFGEAIVIAAIAFALRKKWLLACSALAVGALVHPLMVLYGIGTVFVIAATERRFLWVLLPLGIILLVGLSWLGIEPFARVDYTMPADWWKIVSLIDWNAFITKWRLSDYILILMQVNIGILAFWIGERIEQKLLQALAIVTIVSLLISLIGADLLHNLLIVNAQFFRVTFLFSTIINMFSGVLFLRLCKSTGTSRYYIMLSLIFEALDRYFPTELFPTFFLLFLSSFAFWLENNSGKVSRLWALPLFAIACFIIITTLIILWFGIKIQLATTDNWFFLVSIILVGGFFASILTFFWWSKVVGSAMVAVALLFGLLNFDQRSPLQKFVESGKHPAVQIVALANESQNIYWEGGLDYLWFKLQHTSYYSHFQCVGSMFYELTAKECERRGQVLSRLNTTDFDNTNNGTTGFPKLDFNKYGPTSITQIKDVCQELPDLDLIVLFTKVPDADPVEWTAPVPQYSTEINSAGVASLVPQTHYYFYQCAALRGNAPQTTVSPGK